MATKKILSVEDILAAPDIQEKLIEVPEWGGAVKIKSFTREEVYDIRQRALVGGQVDERMLEMLFLVHGISEPKFSEEHIIALRKKNAAVIERILREIFALSGLGRLAVDEAKRQFPETA